MSHPEILLTTTGTIGLIFLVIFAGIIPICISAKATKDEEYDDEEDWMNALVGMYCFLGSLRNIPPNHLICAQEWAGWVCRVCFASRFSAWRHILPSRPRQ